MKKFLIAVILILSFSVGGLADEKTLPKRPVDLPVDRIYYSFLPANKAHPLVLMCYKSYTIGEDSFDYEEIWVMSPDENEWYWPSKYPRYYFYDFNGDGKMQESEVLWDELEDGQNGNEVWLDGNKEKERQINKE